MIRSSDPTAAPRHGPYSPARLGAVTALLILMLVLGTGAMLFVSYQDTLRQQKTTLRNLSIAFAAQTLSVAQAVDQALRQVERGYRPAARPGAARPGVARPGVARLDYFDERGPAQEYLLGIHVYDRAGRLVASGSSPTAAHAPAAPASPRVADNAAPQIRITAVHPHTGRGVINVARALRGTGGQRIGTILAQVDSERFEGIYSLVELGEGGSVTLFHRDGTMLVRGPSLASGIGRSYYPTPLFQQHLPVSERGTIDTRSPIDGKQRLYGYDAVSGYPLVIISGMDKSNALASWYGRVWTAALFLGMFSVAVVLLAWRVARDACRKYALIARLEASEARAGKSADYLATILNAVGTPIWVLDSARRIVMCNDAFRRFVGGAAGALTGQAEAEVLDPDSAGARARHYDAVFDSGRTGEALTALRDSGGDSRTVIQQTSPLLDQSGQVQLVSVLADITERQKAEAHLAYLADFDALTGLPNRNQFGRLLAAELAEAARQGKPLGALVVSLTRLHEISDLLGQEAGDAALKQVGALFQSLLPHAAGVARIKGHEFALVVRASNGRSDLEEFALELHHRLAEPLTLQGREFFLDAVLGVAIYPQDGASADELFRHADSARNRSGADAGDSIRFFSESTQSDLDERLAVEAQLRRALERGEFRVVYQPKVAIGSGRIVGFEALLRWNNPVLGEVSPVRFIPIAERTGLIVPIGAWVFEQTCRQMRRWNSAGTCQVRVAVNLSPRQLYQKDLIEMIVRCLDQSGIDPTCLELEITESALMSREQEVDQRLRAIRALGIELSIDDFGTGYSSLAYLKRFPVQRLKIDRAFIRDLGRDEDSAAIVLSIINLARGLKLAVVAEGVETHEQLEMLRALSCDEYQGFLFSRPVEADAVDALIARNGAQTF